MENNFEKIANIELHISDNCSEENKKILEYYWKMENKDFKNLPSLVTKEFNITQNELNNLNTTYASLSLYLLCENCSSYEKHLAKSHFTYKHVISNHRRKHKYPIKCNHCIEVERENQRLEFIRKKEEYILKQNSAIENKNWENLSNFERAVLGNCLEMNFNQLKHHYGKLLGRDNFYDLIRALKTIEHQNLIELYKESDNSYIKGYHIENKLKAHKEEIIFLEEVTESSVEIDSETNEIKFKLTINENQQHPDQPIYAGTVTFNERIVIEPGIEYVFGQWQRANNNLYLTMIPIDNLEKTPTQRRVSKLPISIQKGVKDFLNNIGKNNNF